MSVYFAGGVTLVALLAMCVLLTRQHSGPSLRVASQHLVKPCDVRVNDWLQGHGRVTSVEPLETSGVLVRTTNELLVCRTTDKLTVLRRRAEDQ